MFLEVFPSGPIETNAYLFACPTTKKAAVIDAPFESAEWLISRSQELSLVIDKILLTHSHWDHIGDVADLKKATGAQVYVHREDAANLENPGADKLPLLYPVKGIKADHLLVNGQILQIGTLTVQVICTPGHSAGSVCYYLEKEKVLFSGDTLFRGTIGNLSFPTSRPDLMGDSLKALAKLPPDVKVYPGHGSPTTIKAEKWIKQIQIGDRDE